ncbi:mechanosensitive ion channel family protein [candidate division KSB1 bacterium]|nr:mechanosensitive ion channel family protein [candidate division KSB1 bacterium]
MGVFNWLLFIVALLSCFYIIPPARNVLTTDFRYFLIIVAIIILTVFVQRLVRFALGQYLQKSAENLKVDPTAFSFIKNALNAIIFFIAIFFIFYSIPAFRALGTTLLASAGIVAAVAAFASQHALANIVSGIFIVIFKPFRVDDIIKIGTDILGKVEDITLRHTVIRNFENRRVIIPNSTISSDVIINSNLVEEKICVHLEIGISYDSDINKAMHIMRTLAEKHSMCIDNRDEEKKAKNKPIVVVRVIALADFSVNLRAWVWAQNADDAFVMKCDLLKQTKEEFDRQGIEIPFPHRTLVYKKDVLEERAQIVARLEQENKLKPPQSAKEVDDIATD